MNCSRKSCPNATGGINFWHKPMKLQCSCSACDSISCFTKRQANQLCDCTNCKSSNTCLNYDNAKNKSHSTVVSLDEEELDEKFRKEFNEEIIVENEIDKDTKDIMKTDRKLDEIIRNKDKLIHEVEKLTVATSRKTVSPSTAKLSAQIMNVPLKDFENSITKYKPEPLSQIPKMSLLELFHKLKEVYKICSCKVCECIVGKSQKNDLCKCKPCECEDCNSFKNFSGQELSYLGYAICERGSYKESTKYELKQECYCNQCQCIQCANIISKPCSCEPCQCIECSPRKLHKHQTLVVAAVGDDNQTHQVCQCSPCACIECGHGLGMTSNLIRHEMSTGLNRHPRCHCETCLNEACLPDSNATCRCERRDRVMRKPVERDSTDYDIRSATISRNIRQDRDRRNTIAMFTSISNRFINYNSFGKKCTCDPCECLYCTYKEDSANAIKSSSIFTPNINPKMYNSMNTCKRPLYDCELFTKNCNNNNKTTSNCDCSQCACLNCERLSIPLKDYPEMKAISKFSNKGKCQCNPCECTDCDRVMISCTGDICDCMNCKCENCIANDNFPEVIYPIKRGETLTPAIFQNKMNRSFTKFYGERVEENNVTFSSCLSLLGGSKVKFQGDFSDSEVQHFDSQINSLKNKQECINQLITRPETVQHTQLSPKIAANAMNTFNKIKPMNFQASSESVSSISNCKDSESVSLQSRYKNKSRESSCNSSGHDYSNYLVQFPKSTAKTCLNDIINFNTETDIKLDETLDVTLGINSINQHLRVSSTFFDNEYTKCTFHSKHVPPSPTKDDPRKTDKLSYDECSHMEKESFSPELVTVSNQCSFINRESTNRTFCTTQTENLNERCTQRNESDYDQCEDFNKEIYFCKARKPKDFTSDEDYERAKRTLEDARGFSQQLLKLLKKYEKANKEFVSVSHDHPDSCHSHNTMAIVPNKTDLRSSEKVFISKSKNYNASKDCTDNVPTKDENSNSVSVEYVDLLQENMNKNIDMINVVQFTNESNCSDYKDLSSENGWDVIDSIKNESTTEFKQGSSKHYLSLNSSDTENNSNSNISLIDDSIHSEKNLNPIVEEKEPSSDRTDSPIQRHNNIKKKLKSYNKMYKRAVVVSKRTKRLVPKVAMRSITTEISNTFINQLNNYECSYKSFRSNLYKQSTSKEKGDAVADINLAAIVKNQAKLIKIEPKGTLEKHNESKDKTIVMIKPPIEMDDEQAKETQPSPLLNQNFCVRDVRETAVRRFCRQPLVKGAVKSIKWQSKYGTAHKGPDVCHQNKALLNLFLEVKNMLKLPLLQRLETAMNDNIHELEQNNEINTAMQTLVGKASYEVEIESMANSCEAMKVSFLTVRRVSAHTVMVKWTAPRTLTNVQGYELLVDGRAVQKILSVSRCVAVVTCLPHDRQILLTVRTVTISPCASGHNPSTTIVYTPNPRVDQMKTIDHVVFQETDENNYYCRLNRVPS